MWLTQSSIRSSDYISKHAQPFEFPQKAHDNQFTLLSYNVDCDSCFNSSYPGKRALKIISAISSANSDIVCLQETHDNWEAVMGQLISTDIYPYRSWHDPPPDAFPGGIGILSKFPIIRSKLLPNINKIQGSWFPMWTGRIELPTKQQIKLCVVHLRPPLYNLGYQWGILSPSNTNQYRLEEVKYLARHLARSPHNHLPTIIAGDFNENDSGGSVAYLTNNGNGQGIGKGAVTELFNWIRGAEETNIEKALSSFKFVDAVQQFVPSDVETHRFPIPMQLAKDMVLRSRLDHIVYTRDRLECCACFVMPGYEKGASDHMPIFTQFSILNESKIGDADSESSSEGDPEALRQQRLLQALKGMGFTNEKRNLQVMLETDNLEQMVEILLNERANQSY